MAKNYEKNSKKARYLEQKLRENKQYVKIFEKYRMDKNADLQVCNFVEFSEVEKRRNGERPLEFDEVERAKLEKVYMLIQEEENRAVMVNIDKAGEIPTGEIAVYDLQKQQFHLTNEEIANALDKQVMEDIDQYAKDIFDLSSQNKENELIKEAYPENLEEMQRLILRRRKRS